MLKSLSMDAKDAGMQRNLWAILTKGANFVWFAFQNVSRSSCGKQGESKYSFTN